MNRSFRPDELEAVKNARIITECPECDAQFYDAVEKCFNCGFIINENYDW